MNSRSSVNETNLVNFSADLSNQLDSKDGLLSFPFDHIYACHSQSSDRSQPLDLEKEIEISTHCIVEDESSPEVAKLNEQVVVAENQNRKLKDLMIFHLDLIQQQNELITKRDKLYIALKQENDALKAKLIRMDKRVGFTPRHTQQHIPSSTITSSVIKAEPSTSQMILNSFRDLLPPDQGNSLISEKNKAFGHETFGIARVKLEPPGSPTYNPPEILPPIVKVPPPVVEKLKPIGDPYKMIDNKRSLVKKDVKTESRSEALYTVTSNSGNPIIQRIHKNRRKSNNIGSLSRMSKTPKAIPATATSLSKVPEPNQSYDNTYGFNKKSKMINTYGKSRNSTTIPKRTMHFTGSLSDRLQLIDTTPTGEDPYQLGEADMREQSPIPKLMLQKTNHGRMKICNDSMGGTGTRRIYDMPDTKAKINRFMSVYEQPKKSQPKKEQPNKEQPKRVQPKKQQPKKDQTKKEQPTKTIIVHEPDLDMIKTEPGIAWPSNMFDQQVNEPSMCDFSYGESAAYLPSLDATEFQELFTSDSALELDHLNQLDDPPEKLVPDKTTKRRMEEVTDSKRGMESRRGRKRAFSTTGLVKPQPPKTQPKPKTAKARGGAAARGKVSPLPDLTTLIAYETLVGDSDLSWYYGLDPNLKREDLDPPVGSQASTVEVPRWRIKHYTSSYTLEGTENLDDKVFEKRHQKYEAEERRQLKWHMRRIREQRHVEKLRQRQRDSWCSSPVNQPSVYTVWPRPQRDAEFIETTKVLPVNAFGEPVPKMPDSNFKLPWVRSSKPMKRSKRSKTLH
ncbi:uncharacterized protein LOC112057663 isoform X2 [Bicyclus anynana]|uniref:Uncharacterized protein LOC112057663 isoform X2 n=1 Tax=Bicyclus anynana TaxID=110368 RepID=A0ABM3M4Z6_BICAN|nr:uncharacterized protein LOC112057663 isoform X2 [Bicyclus anynana]